MKFIRLLTFAYVGGALRHPHEGILHVEDDEANRLVEDKAGEDVSDDFTAKQDKATSVDTITAAAGDATDAPASEPHQSEVAPQAADEAPKPRRKAGASQE